MSNTRYDRPVVKQITKQWVRDNCNNITERDMGLLRLLQSRKLLRRDQIERLYPEFASTDRLNKRLKLLYSKYVIDKIYPPCKIGEGSSKQHICLDKAGILLLELEKYNKPITSDSFGNKALPLGWEHRITLNEYECIICDICKQIGAQILYYHVEKPINFDNEKIIPDICCVIKYNGKGYSFFIEVDLGTEDIPYVKQKIQSYNKLSISSEWHKESWTTIFGKPVFPRVLFLTTDGRQKRINSLLEFTKDNYVRYFFEFHSNFTNLLLNILQ